MIAAPDEKTEQTAALRGGVGDDRVWLGGLTVAVAVVCGLPYVLSARLGPPELQRIGTFWFIHDFTQYQAAMREGARHSSWLIHDHFSAEPHSPALMYPLYVGAGKLAALLGVSDQTTFTVLEWLGRVCVVSAMYVFVSAFLKDRRQRRLAMILALGSLGLDVWAVPLRLALDGLDIHVLDGLLPGSLNLFLEFNSFGVLLSAPHLMFGLALTLTCAPVYLRAIQGSRLWLAALGAAVLTLSLVHSFNTPVLVSVLLVHAALSGRRAWPAATVAALAAAPVTVYSLVLYQGDPFWSSTYGVHNLMPAPPPWALPFDFGLVMLAAPFAGPLVRRLPSQQRWLLLLWIGLGLAWMYAPVPYQRRFAFGVQPALAVLASLGLFEVNAWLRRRRVGPLRRRAVNYGAALAAISTSLLVYMSLLSSALRNAPAEVYLWSRPEAAAAAWLGQHSTAEDVVMAAPGFGNPLAGSIDGRVVDGHAVGTLHNEEKDALVGQFYASQTTAQQRRQLLDQTQATLVALGPQERALGGPELEAEAGLDRIYAQDGVELFRVQR